MRALGALLAVAALALGACGEERPPASPQRKAPPGDALVPPGSSPAQAAAVREVARIRASAGLPPVPGSIAIQRAAQAHADYLAQNPQQIGGGLSAHEEVPGTTGFTGVEFSDRMRAAGYTGTPYSEVIHFVGDPVRAVRGWENSVFHRIPLISHSAGELGYGLAESAGLAVDVMDFGLRTSAVDWNAIVVYPPDGASDVPRFFDGAELPAPTRPPGGWPSGPIVSVVFESPDFEIALHEIVVAGEAHPHVAIDPQTPGLGEFMGDSVAYYTYEPAPVGASVTAHVKGTLNGAPFERTWSFRVK